MSTIASKSAFPVLHSGDHLTFDEFVERAANTKEFSHAELIQGIVFVTPAQRYRFHGQPLSIVTALLTVYMLDTSGTEFGTQTTVKLDDRNGPEPDLFLRLMPIRQGLCDVNDKDYLAGPPELVVEVAASSVSFDLYEKKDMYEEAGVLEYLVWRTEDEQIDCFRLVEGRYQKVVVESGIWESTTFPGLRLDLNAMLRYELQLARKTLQEGMNSEVYLQFQKVIS